MRNKDFEKWAMPRLKKIQKILLLEHFSEPKLFFDADEERPYCAFKYPYQNITIGYTKNTVRAFKEKDYPYLIDVLVHEMCHVLTDGFYNAGMERFITNKSLENEREKLTDHICKIILKNDLF